MSSEDPIVTQLKNQYPDKAQLVKRLEELIVALCHTKESADSPVFSYVSYVSCKIRDLEDKIAQNYSPDLRRFYSEFHRCGAAYPIIAALQYWEISGGRALQLFRDLFNGEEIKLPIDSDMESIVDPKEWSVKNVVPVKEGQTEVSVSVKPGNVLLVVEKESCDVRVPEEEMP